MSSDWSPAAADTWLSDVKDTAEAAATVGYVDSVANRPFELLSDVTLGADGSVTFTEPSAGAWSDIRAFRLTSPHVQTTHTTTGSMNLYIRLNSDAGSNYIYLLRYLTLSSGTIVDLSSSSTGATFGLIARAPTQETNTDRIGTFDALIGHLPGHWTVLRSQAAAANANVNDVPILADCVTAWRLTADVTSLTVGVVSGGGALAAGSRFILEGVRA